MDELQFLAKLDEMLVEMMEHLNFQSYGHGSKRILDGSYRVRRMDSKFLRSPLCCVGAERLSSVCTRNVWGAPSMGVAKVANDKEFASVRGSFVCLLEPQRIMQSDASQVIRPLQESGASSWTLLLAPQEELKASKKTEFDKSVVLDNHLSVALG